jgi:hypothetical protein
MEDHEVHYTHSAHSAHKRKQRRSWLLRFVLGSVLALALTLLVMPTSTYAAPIDWTGVTFTFNAEDLVSNAFGFFELFVPIVAVIGGLGLGAWIVQTVIKLLPGL